MMMSRRVYIALFVVLSELVVVAASGNQWLTKFIADNEAPSPLGDEFLRSVPSFPWRFSPQSGEGATTVFAAQFAAIGALLVLTFVFLIIVLRGAPTFSGPSFATFTVVTVSAIVAQMVG